MTFIEQNDEDAPERVLNFLIKFEDILFQVAKESDGVIASQRVDLVN